MAPEFVENLQSPVGSQKWLLSSSKIFKLFSMFNNNSHLVYYPSIESIAFSLRFIDH